jgi:hypothetical protein
VRTDEETEETRRRRFAGGWTSLTSPSSSSSEDVEHEEGGTFIGSVVDGTAVVTICDLRRRGVCDCSIPSVSCVKNSSLPTSRPTHEQAAGDGEDQACHRRHRQG